MNQRQEATRRIRNAIPLDQQPPYGKLAQMLDQLAPQEHSRRTKAGIARARARRAAAVQLREAGR